VTNLHRDITKHARQELTFIKRQLDGITEMLVQKYFSFDKCRHCNID